MRVGGDYNYKRKRPSQSYWIINNYKRNVPASPQQRLAVPRHSQHDCWGSLQVRLKEKVELLQESPDILCGKVHVILDSFMSHIPIA